MSVTYGALIALATREVALAAVELHTRPPDTVAAGRALLVDYHGLLRALARHTHQVVDRHVQPGGTPGDAPDRDARIALALAAELKCLAGPRPFPLERDPSSNHWRSAAVAVGAAGDLLATHGDRTGLARSPDLLAGLSSSEARRVALGQIADLAAAAMSPTDELARSLVNAGVWQSRIRGQVRDPIAAEVLARALTQHAGTAEAGLDDLRTARPQIDTTDPLAELGDRIAHLRRYAWAATRATRPSADDLKAFAVLGIAVHTHAEAFTHMKADPGGPAGLVAAVESHVPPRSQSWREVSARLQPWQTIDPANPAVVAHTRRVAALLAEVVPLSGQPGTSVFADCHVTQALTAAVQVTEAISGWNAETLEGLRRTGVTMPARALTGAQVSDDRTLAAAKLAGARIEVPPIAYQEALDAYAAASGRTPAGTGVLEPLFAAGVRSSGVVDLPRLGLLQG